MFYFFCYTSAVFEEAKYPFSNSGFCIVIWQRPPASPVAEARAAHVWAVDLDRETAYGLTEVLSAQECARADGFRFEKDRAHFVAARGSLRVILAKYARCEPGELAFFWGEQGKPMLSSPWDAVKFNLSHSAGLALIAVSAGCDIGVDVEHRGRVVGHVTRIAKRFFAPREYEMLCRLPQEEQRRAFLCCWTRKEAYVKALGTSLLQSSKKFEVSLGGEAKLLRARAGDAENWTLRHLDPRGGYVGAVAVAGKDIDVRCWTA